MHGSALTPAMGGKRTIPLAIPFARSNASDQKIGAPRDTAAYDENENDREPHAAVIASARRLSPFAAATTHHSSGKDN